MLDAPPLEASEVSELYSRSGHTPSVSSRSEGRSLDEPEEVDGRMAPEVKHIADPRLGLSDKSSKESGSLSAPGQRPDAPTPFRTRLMAPTRTTE
eukprot:g6391.t1